MLTELEAAIIAKLQAGGVNTKIFDFRKDRNPRKENVPTVFPSIDAAEFEPGPDDKFFQDVTITLAVVFKVFKGEADRRLGIYPVIEGIIQSLQLQNLGLDIEPLQPRGFKNITDVDDAQIGEIIYEIEFWTQYTVDKAAADPAPVDLLRIGVEYFLQEPTDDGEADAGDLIE